MVQQVLDQFIRLSSPSIRAHIARMRKVADRVSGNPDLLLTLVVPKGSMVYHCFDLLLLAAILPYSSKDLNEVNLRTSMANLALGNINECRFNKLLYDLAVAKQFYLYDMIEKFLKYMTPEEFFGILVQYLNSNRYKTGIRFTGRWNHEYTEASRVKRSQRKRGYTDKGSAPDPRHPSSARLIKREEAKEQPIREKWPKIDLIPPRRWWGRK